MSMTPLPRENSHADALSFRDAYLLAKAEVIERHSRAVTPSRCLTPPRTPPYAKRPETWFTGTWADVDDAQVGKCLAAARGWQGVGAAAPRSPRSMKWASMEADMASHCEEDPCSPLLARNLPTSPPSASSSPSKGVDSAISALRPWLQSMRGRALGAFAFPAERVWLRAIIKGWRHITSAGMQARSSARGGNSVQDRVAEGLVDALEVLQSFIASPSTTAAGLVLRLRRLHNEVGEMWTEHLKSEAAAAQARGDHENGSKATGALVGTDESAVTFFHRCVRDLVAQQSKACTVTVSRGRGRPLSMPKTSELTDLKAAIAHELCFRRLRGALSYGAAVWGSAYDRTEEVVFQAAVKRVLSVLFTLDAITHAIPGAIHREEDAFRIQEFSTLEEVPLPLVEALQQLGPL